MKKLKAVSLGLAIASAFFWFAYFITGISSETADFWGAVGLLCFMSALIGVAWGLCIYLDRKEGVSKKGEQI